MLDEHQICIGILGYFPRKPSNCFINRMYRFDHSKHNGLFKYCDFNIHTLCHKELWYMNKNLMKDKKSKKTQ